MDAHSHNIYLLCFYSLDLRGNRHKIPLMIAEIRRLLAARPFVRFTIYPADGAELQVPTVDRAAVSPDGLTVVVFFNDGTAQPLFPLLIARVATRVVDRS
jgi:hypothetical protein